MMNKKYVFNIAKNKTPNIKTHIHEKWLRHNIVNNIEGKNNIGIELGVATGVFSKRMIATNKFKRFYGVDSYSGVHDDDEYKNTLKNVGFHNPVYSLLRLEFENVIDLFEDEYFDFIYVDGFAHTGEEGGKSLIDWYKKLKVGGIMSGDDYHDDWPLVKWAVNDFAFQLNAEINITGGKEDADYSKYPTWYIQKKKHQFNLKINEDLYRISMKEKRRIHNLRMVKQIIKKFLKIIGLKKIVTQILKKLNLHKIIK